MKHKFGLLSLIGLLIISLLIACSNEDGKDGNAKKEDQPKNEEEITLSFVHWINEETGGWEELIAKYEAENEGVKIESIPLVENMSTQDYLQQLDLLAGSGESLDIIMFSTMDDLVKRVDAGLVAPIDEFLDAENIDINSEYNNIYSAIDGNYYAIPTKSVASLIMLNKDHLDEVGLEIPTDWTWDDFKEYAKQLTTDDRYGTLLTDYHTLHSTLKMFGKSENPSLFKEDGNSNMMDPLIKESLELRYQMENEDKSAVPYAETISQQLDFRQQFFSGSISMLAHGSFLISEWGQFTPDFEIAWAPWPKNSEDSVNYTQFSGDGMAVAQTSEHKEEAYNFIRWFSTEGMVEQGLSVPSWTGADLDVALEKILSGTSNPDATNIESLKHALSAVEPQKIYVSPVYAREAGNEFFTQADLFLLDEQDIDTTIEQAHEKLQEVVDANQ